MTAQEQPNRGELLAMAYVDRELSGDELASFEARLATDSELSGHVAHYRALELLARNMAPQEPQDHEWAQLRTGALQGSMLRLAWGLVAIGGAGLAAYGVYSLATSDSITSVNKAGLLALLGGSSLLLALAIRSRIRLLPFDPYRKVKR